jgi:hypothetical protein
VPESDPRSDSALRRLVDRVPDVVFRFSLVPEPRIEYISEATSRLLGYAPEEFYAEPELGLSTVHPDDRGRLMEMVRTGATTPGIIRYLHRNGSIAWAEVKLNPFWDGDVVVGVDGVVREIPNPTVRANAGIPLGDGLRIDMVHRQVTVDGEPVHLTAAEFKLLFLLAEQPGRTVSRPEIMEHLWRSPHGGDGHACETHVSNLRKKIGPSRIATVRGRGYRFEG